MNGENLEFQIGKLTGQMTALVTQVLALSSTLTLLDERLRKNETNTTILMVKMSMISVVSGAVGAFLMQFIQSALAKYHT